MSEFPFKLTDLLSAAGATIGVIIASTIFLQFLNAKYNDLVNRYRGLTGEYRGENGHDDRPRRQPLQSQIRTYRRRLVLLNWASRLAGVALFGFLTAVGCGGLSMAFKEVIAFAWVGSAALFTGLGLMLVGVTLEVWEGVLSRNEIADELADLDEPVKATSMR